MVVFHKENAYQFDAFLYFSVQYSNKKSYYIIFERPLIPQYISSCGTHFSPINSTRVTKNRLKVFPKKLNHHPTL